MPTSDNDAQLAADIEAGRRLFTLECRFVALAATEDQVPAPSLPEIAFAGRSNVGKSSLINALTGRNTLARVSQTPGRTRQLAFFNLGRRLMLVDLPGHGFARAARAEVAAWTRLVRAFLRGRPSLQRCCLLIDARHGVKDSDEALMDQLDEAAVVYQLVLTKVDKASAAEIGERRAEFSSLKRPALHPELISTSAHDGTGIAELRAVLARLAAPSPIG